MQIESPYNFVPAPEEQNVCKPKWEVSQDFPVPGSLSGTINFDILAESPIFIRNSHQPGQDREKEVVDFSHYFLDGKKQFFIPGSSVKGAIRSVVEIMSCSRLSIVDGIQESNKVAYGMRDMANPQYSKVEVRNLKSGWLKKTDKGWSIQECDHHRVALADLVAHFQLQRNGRWARPLVSYIDDKDKTERIPSAYEKAREIGKDNMGKWQELYFLRQEGPVFGGVAAVGDVYGFQKNDKKNFKSRLVVFGHMNNKRYEFLFGVPSESSYPVEAHLVEKLLSRESEKELFDFYKSCNNGELPVFYKLDKDKVKHFGFSKLYRLNNAGYLREKHPFVGYANPKSEDYEEDFAEKLFGHVHGRVGALRGRVLFAHAKAETASELLKNGKPFELVLNGPKPSYYPNYLKQDYERVGGEFKSQGHYKTYHNADATVRGFKRYPVHSDIKQQNEGVGTDAMVSKLIPLNTGAKFLGQIVYHNLTPVELGALLSALTFHGQETGSFHTLGQGKPYGFGKVSIKLNLTAAQKEAMAAFELYMQRHCKERWLDGGAMKELYAMSRSPETTEVNDLLVYPKLGQIDRENEFNKYKERSLVLEPYSIRNDERNTFQSCLTTDKKPAAEAIIKELDEANQPVAQVAGNEKPPCKIRQEAILKALNELKSQKAEEQAKIEVGRKADAATEASKERLKAKLLAEGPNFSNMKPKDHAVLKNIGNILRAFTALIGELRPTDVEKTENLIRQAWASQSSAMRKKWDWHALEKYFRQDWIEDFRKTLT